LATAVVVYLLDSLAKLPSAVPIDSLDDLTVAVMNNLLEIFQIEREGIGGFGIVVVHYFLTPLSVQEAFGGGNHDGDTSEPAHSIYLDSKLLRRIREEKQRDSGEGVDGDSWIKFFAHVSRPLRVLFSQLAGIG